MRLPYDVYRNISALRNILKNSSRTSTRTLRVNTSIWGRTSYDITQDQLQSLIGLRFTVPQIAELLQVSTRTIEHRLAEYSGLARGRERHFRTGKRADNLDTTLFRLPVLALPFSPSSSGRHFAGFPVVIKTPSICVHCVLINEMMLFGMISELISNITRLLSLFYSVNLWKFTATFILDSRKETRSSASDLRF